MSSGPRPRRPFKVVVLVLVFWIAGNLLQSVLATWLEGSGIVSPDVATYVALAIGWGLLFLLSLYFREQLDRWLRT